MAELPGIESAWSAAGTSLQKGETLGVHEVKNYGM